MYTLKNVKFKLKIKFQNKAKIIKMCGNKHNNYFSVLQNSDKIQL